MLEIFQRWIGWKKVTEVEIQEQRDIRMRSQYFDPIERFPDRIDQLLDALNRICMSQTNERSKIKETTF
ncbi:unnamed protein product [Adineta steineri]|uniref:Uncharacterized protein n=2 Tax=Adineta steineri TaxID=433720 RepID=A0A820IHE2_9BILA|nr:unnamed protein product [Adineta steineri]